MPLLWPQGYAVLQILGLATRCHSKTRAATAGRTVSPEGNPLLCAVCRPHGPESPCTEVSALCALSQFQHELCFKVPSQRHRRSRKLPEAHLLEAPRLASDDQHPQGRPRPPLLCPFGCFPSTMVSGKVLEPFLHGHVVQLSVLIALHFLEVHQCLLRHLLAEKK
jgi:hypothetical protein